MTSAICRLGRFDLSRSLYDAARLGGSSPGFSSPSAVHKAFRLFRILLFFPALHPLPEPWLCPRSAAIAARSLLAFATLRFRYVRAEESCDSLCRKVLAVMKIVRFMTCAALAGSVVMTAHAGAAGAMVAMPDPSAGSVEGEAQTPIVPVQYNDYGRPGGWNGGHAGPGGPGWRGGLPGGWYGRPGWYGDPPGQPRSYPSQWGGGWYGGWYQPYWGQGNWSSPNWTYGSEHYWGHYPAPTACGPNGCGQDYVPLK